MSRAKLFWGSKQVHRASGDVWSSDDGETDDSMDFGDMHESSAV
jgi:hypothetical protein